MKLVVDTNVVISALIKDGTTRKLLFHPALELHSPLHLFVELENHASEICEKAGMEREEVGHFISMIRKIVKILPDSSYADGMHEAHGELQDVGDVPFLAAAVTFGFGIWSEDKDFLRNREKIKEKFGISVWTTREIYERLRKL